MIKVTKDLNDIPETLVKGSTLSKRNGVISSKKFPSSNSSSSEKEKKKVKDYESRYKQSDIKKSLKLIYNEKCAFCEQKIIECKDNNLEECSSTVEHYRPKRKYYWLAYSWDNLLWCCYRCNQNKDNNFEIVNSPVEYEKNFKDKIHVSTKSYQEVEEPKMIHPEFESVIDKLSFNKKGGINSNDGRIEYTIETCGLDRKDLKDKRKTLIDDFIENMIDKKLKNEPITNLLQELLSDVKKAEKEFIALRYWILKNYESLIEVD